MGFGLLLPGTFNRFSAYLDADERAIERCEIDAVKIALLQLR
ncbi:hypothetical protein [Sphingomonas sp. M1-B02]|nr:hypothetical protein [Sphingomonas sp. S6-11]UZK64822.1 hypothetical protein OKW87_09775 [Sphingomonas sp. S6-11]